MPLINQYRLHENDPMLNPHTFYVYLENDAQKGGDHISQMLRWRENTLPLTVKKTGGEDIKSYHSDEQYIPIVYHLNLDFEKIRNRLNRQCVVVFPMEIANSSHIIAAHYELSCPKFFKYFWETLNSVMIQYKPREYPDHL